MNYMQTLREYVLGRRMLEPPVENEYAAACARLRELAVQQYERSYEAESKGFMNAAATCRMAAKALAIAIRALQGEEIEIPDDIPCR